MKRQFIIQLLLLCSTLVQAPAAWASDRKTDLIETLVSNADVVADQEAVRLALTDIEARRLFSGLRNDSRWNARHPLWRQNFQAFLGDYRELVNAYLGDVAAAQRQRLATMPEADLAEAVKVRLAPNVVSLFSRLRAEGISSATALWIPDVVSHSQYYTNEERARFELVQKKLQSPGPTLIPLLLQMEDEMRHFGTPALVAYTNVVGDTLTRPIENFPSKPETRPMLLAFLREWQVRINPDSR